ncbi:MAG TPA: 3-oxoacyl-[acyl-carrier-protein] reductase [Bacteroidota bacterium]
MGVLQDKIALVTGGSRGIGRAVVLALADEGCHVAFTYKSAGSAAEEVVKAVEAKGRKAMAIQSDAKAFQEAAAAVEKVVQEFKRLDVLVNNAGITKDTLLLRMTEQDWDEVIDTNLKSAFNFSKAACKQMIGQREGRIINMSSIAGVIGNAGQTNYAAAKAGMLGMTKTLAKELASRNIQVNAIAPGFVETDMTHKLTPQQKEALLGMVPLKRVAKPEEIASVVVFLASPASSYMTGQVLCVDGGLVM